MYQVYIVVWYMSSTFFGFLVIFVAYRVKDDIIMVRTNVKELSNMTIGDRIREKRDEHGMTLEDIAKLIGVSRQTMSRYETGAIKGVPSDKIELIAKALGTTPGYLMGWEDKSEDIKKAATQAAFRAEMGDFSEEEMFLVRTYRYAPEYERVYLYSSAVIVMKATAAKQQDANDRDGQLAAESLTRQYLQSQSLPEVGEK